MPGSSAAQQIVRAEWLILALIESNWVTIVLVIVGVFANPQSAQRKRWAAARFIIRYPGKRLMSIENFYQEEVVIRQLEEKERQAVLQHDIAALERLWAEEFIVNYPQNQISPSRGAVLMLVQRGLIRYAAFERQIEAIRFSADIAIVMGAESVEPVGDTPHAGETVRRRFTNIWRKHGATWHMIARHANVIAPATAARN